ncbi:glycosyltransferase family 4 protein [Yinghuangia seranimata]|uniref:glycosyltransferase family 4 protein n=1 Tax=Yinghuangia seranimata TaxID=408067 RepID=UPI00248C1AD9|nr:glycosyltransferase family 4 protein [Yinghuangia seranimata]MDI2132267.1 glycosyltransferase family 4 protein [Yinghuangia seranimata]
MSHPAAPGGPAAGAPESAATGPERRRRAVMVVGNFVDGDSRVQKTARSVAEAGWDVVLLGRARGVTREEYAIGPARVIRLPLRMTAQTFRRDHPPRGVAGRLGYRSGEQARMRVDARRALRADLAVERRLAELDGDLAARLRVTGLTAVDRARGYWIEARRRLYDRSAARAGGPTRTRLAVGLGRDGGAWLTQPQLVDFDAAFAPVIAELAPDLLHAHDFDTIGLATRAALKLRASGHPVKVVYDAHEYIAGWERPGDPAFRPAMAAQERKYIRLADGVVTVSDTIAGLLADDHGLAEPPTVVCNAPTVAELAAGDDAEPLPDVREAAGLGPDVPLLVYSGMTAPERGLDTAVAALPALPGVHLAMVTARNPYVDALEAQATGLGVADRLHMLPYVEPRRLVAHLAGGSVGVVTSLHSPNYELSLPSKYYEYLNARLPLVVSDLRTVGAFTREQGIGEVYPAGDPAAFAAAVTTVLADRARYTKPYAGDLLDRNTWEAQVPALLGLYERLVP